MQEQKVVELAGGRQSHQLMAVDLWLKAKAARPLLPCASIWISGPIDERCGRERETIVCSRWWSSHMRSPMESSISSSVTTGQNGPNIALYSSSPSSVHRHSLLYLRSRLSNITVSPETRRLRAWQRCVWIQQSTIPKFCRAGSECVGR